MGVIDNSSNSWFFILDVVRFGNDIDYTAILDTQ